jgi:D-alanyl-D-alanine endopeptidase (penicillin-binding protein 7)
MQTTWDNASYRVVFMTLLLLLFAVGMSEGARAGTTASKEAKTSTKAAGAQAIKPVIVKRSKAAKAKKSTRAASRHSVKAIPSEATRVKRTRSTASVAHDTPPHSPRVVHRQNLRTVAYTPGAAAALATLPIHPEPDTNDIVVYREEAAPTVEPLTSRAMVQSEVAFVQDLDTDAVLYDKNSDEVRPIASISKLMTALVVAESGLPMKQILQISDADVDRVRYSRSRLPVGTELTRADMLHLALMSSENRAAHALGRYYPGGMPAFVRAMNDKARSLGMRNTRFVEPTGLSAENVSTSRDLVQLLRATSEQPLIRRYTTHDKYAVDVGRGRQLTYNNTNRLVKNANWDIQISKTGFINEAGECLVMLTRIDNRDVAIVLLNANGRYTRIEDAVRMRSLVEKSSSLAML